MITKVTVTPWKYPDDVRALYGLYDMFRHSEASGGDTPFKRIVPEPIRFARYLLDHPEKWAEAQEMTQQAKKWLEAQMAEREKKN